MLGDGLRGALLTPLLWLGAKVCSCEDDGTGACGLCALCSLVKSMGRCPGGVGAPLLKNSLGGAIEALGVEGPAKVADTGVLGREIGCARLRGGGATGESIAETFRFCLVMIVNGLWFLPMIFCTEGNRKANAPGPPGMVGEAWPPSVSAPWHGASVCDELKDTFCVARCSEDRVPWVKTGMKLGAVGFKALNDR